MEERKQTAYTCVYRERGKGERDGRERGTGERDGREREKNISRIKNNFPIL